MQQLLLICNLTVRATLGWLVVHILQAKDRSGAFGLGVMLYFFGTKLAICFFIVAGASFVIVVHAASPLQMRFENGCLISMRCSAAFCHAKVWQDKRPLLARSGLCNAFLLKLNQLRKFNLFKLVLHHL